MALSGVALAAGACRFPQEEDEEGEDEEEEEEEEVSPEDLYALSLAEAIDSKGGTTSLSSLGAVPKPAGIKTKLSVFIKGRPEFTRQGDKVSLVE